MDNVGFRNFAMALVAAWCWGSQVQASESGLPTTKSPARTMPRTRAHARAKPETAASWQARHGLFFQRNWGVEIIGVRRVSSGLMLRFDYRVVAPSRAVALNNKNARPYLIDEATNTALSVPAMENVGELRQVAPQQANRSYFMIFGNPGGLVKRHGRVTVVVGNLRVEGLEVE